MHSLIENKKKNLFMNIKKYKVLGIMSGTSCDGLDIAYCEYWEKNNKWNYKLLDFITINYNKNGEKNY